MRHGKRFKHLNRNTAHRKGLLRNLAISLIVHKRITTTVAKAKALRKFVEPLLTKCKTKTQHSHRVLFSYLQNKKAMSELFKDICFKIENRNGGYTRIIKTGFRKGDNAAMCMIELVDYNDTYQIPKEKKTRRTRRSSKKKQEQEIQNQESQNEEKE